MVIRILLGFYRLILIFVFSLVFSSSAVATQQIKDMLYYNGEQYPIDQTPLSSIIPRPAISELLNIQTMCSASWRGYKASWKIDKNFLYLTEIRKDPCSNGGKVVPLNVLFPTSSHLVKATWFSGNITSPTGKTWGEERKVESGAIIIEDYKYEVMVFVIYDGVLIEKRTEVISW